MSDETPPKRSRLIVVLLVALPLWLVLSGGFAVWYFLRQEKLEAEVERQRFVQAVSAVMIADDLRKLVDVIGERHASSAQAAANLRRAASMIEGLLGPSNTGFTVTRHRGPGDHPLLQVTLRGLKTDAPAVWVITSYDSRPGSPGVEANATGLAATLAAAQALADHQPLVPIHFLFVPHANDPGSPVAGIAPIVANLAARPGAVLCVEAMGAGETLWLSSNVPKAPPLGQIEGLGSVIEESIACPGGRTGLAGLLARAGLPAVRVATRPAVAPDEPDTTVPAAVTVAASAGRLVELLRRCAAIPPP
jgi:hypothetical protein